VELWKQCIEQSATYVMKMSLYVDYWEDVLLHLSKSLPTQRFTLWRALAFQQLEVELCESWVVVHKADFLFKRLGHLSLLWAQELKANFHIHPV
jgi:hypothetical protein